MLTQNYLWRHFIMVIHDNYSFPCKWAKYAVVKRSHVRTCFTGKAAYVICRAICI